jgi:hypothetical protein
MYEVQKKNVKAAANQIVENINKVAKKGKKETIVEGKGYLGKVKGTVHMPDTDTEINVGLEKFMEKTVDGVKKSSKKVKVDVK